MLKRQIKYKDFDEVEQTDTYYFNLSTSELVEMDVGLEGGLANHMQRIIDAKDYKSLIEEFKSLILKAYGEKSADGKRFVKSEELAIAFSQTAAYDSLFVQLATDTQAAVEFMNGIIPPNLRSDQDKPILPPPSPTTVDI